MNDYRAKTAYQNENEASSYDKKRFTSLRGRIGDYLDRRALKRAFSQLSNHQVQNLIDIPCGTSRIMKDLLKLGYNLQGSDISFEMMENGKHKVNQYRTFWGFTQCDASLTAFNDDSFDCLICVRFIGHIPSDYRKSIFSEFNRISRFSIIELSLESNLVKLRKRMDRLIKSGTNLPNRWEWEVFNKSGLETEFSDSGLRIITMWPKFRFFSDSWFILVGEKS
jgi:ubiquinone/menaquinone biosynthesis C-methylase UbiE